MIDALTCVFMQPDASSLQFFVLGSVGASRGRAPITLGGRRQRAVLAILLTARGQPVTSERLIDLLWPETALSEASGSLYASVSRLRRGLAAPLISTEAGGYALRVPDDAVDGWRFAKLVSEAAPRAGTEPAAAVPVLRDALELWRGEAFVEYRDEPWAQPEIGTLNELRDVAREQLACARLAMGEREILVPELEDMVAQSPLREERWRLLALALYRCGRQGDALGALRRARVTLADELGVDPGPALRVLEAQLLGQDPALGAPEAPAATPAAPPVPVTPVRPAAPAQRGVDELIERAREVNALRSALGEAVAGHGQIALITGPAGIGKSRLLTEIRRLAAEAGVTVYSARSSDLEQQFGFGVVRQLFERAVREAAAEQPLLTDAAARAAGIFEPAAAGTTPIGDDAAFALLHGLYWLTERLAARGPLVLAVDDLHWCDQESMRYLAYLSRRIDQLPILLAATERSGERYAASDVVRDIESDPSTVVVNPQLLSRAGTYEVVRDRLGAEAHPAFADACYDVSSGNPLLLRQLLRALESDGVTPDARHADRVRSTGSRAVATMVLHRLRRLSATAVAAVRALAVLGDGADLPAVAGLAGVAEPDAAACTDELARAEILLPRAGLSFVHALVRDAIYQDIAVGDRPLMHERAAHVLDERGAEPEAVAAQLLQAPHRGDPWAVQVLRRSAAAAAARGASEAVIVYLRRVLDEPCAASERADVLDDLGRTEAAQHGPAALLHLTEAYDLLTDQDRKADTAIQLARTMVFAGAPGSATAFARQAGAALPAGLDDERQALLALERIAGHMHGMPAGRWDFEHEPAIAGGGVGSLMLRATVSWERLCAAAPCAGAVRLAREALTEQELYRVDNGLLWVVATTTQELADVDVMQLWEAALAHAREQGSLFAALSVHLWRGFSYLRRGDLDRALESLSLSDEEMRMWNSPVGSVYAFALMIAALLERGDVAGARAILEQEITTHPGSDSERMLIESHADVLMAEGDHAAALEALDEARGLVRHLVNPVWRREPSYRARALIGLGRHGEAAEILREQLGLARRWGAPSGIARQLRLLARTQPDNAVILLEEAGALMAGSPIRLERAKCLLALGQARIGAGQPGGEGLIAEAAAIAKSCGADRLVARAQLG